MARVRRKSRGATRIVANLPLLALLWQIRSGGVDEEFLTVRASLGRRPCEGHCQTNDLGRPLVWSRFR
jgi:hypothetical protein